MTPLLSQRPAVKIIGLVLGVVEILLINVLSGSAA
ncbi:hypothetical protein sync_1247 [Synechococcus sp. CC9311]|nr:hypothetical protein sync_1247 [Synechococcus sp. CC9311]